MRCRPNGLGGFRLDDRQQVGTRIIAFTPADERTRERLELLLGSLLTA
jgi:hypothetical protein